MLYRYRSPGASRVLSPPPQLSGAFPLHRPACSAAPRRPPLLPLTPPLPWAPPPRRARPGDTGKDPRLNSIGDVKSWQRKRAKGQLAIQALVANLMETYLGRVVVTRPPYAQPPEEALRRLAADFPFSLTPDQETAIADINEDLSREEPMDRLVRRSAAGCTLARARVRAVRAEPGSAEGRVEA